jgi:hypothetical protein
MKIRRDPSIDLASTVLTLLIPAAVFAASVIRESGSNARHATFFAIVGSLIVVGSAAVIYRLNQRPHLLLTPTELVVVRAARTERYRWGELRLRRAAGRWSLALLLDTPGGTGVGLPAPTGFDRGASRDRFDAALASIELYCRQYVPGVTLEISVVGNEVPR